MSKYTSYKLKCLNCEKEYELQLTENQYSKEKYKKCCCLDCSSKYSNSFINYGRMKSAKCIDCNKEIEIKNQSSEKKCRCTSCKKMNKKNKNIKYLINNENYSYKRIIDGEIVCNICGENNCNSDICEYWNRGGSKTLIKLGFDLSTLGSKSFFNEYERFKLVLLKEYENNSVLEISKKYNVFSTSLNSLFKKYNIAKRTNTKSQLLAFKKGKKLKNTTIYPYKSCYHTSWEEKTFWLRSSYELEYAKELDKNKIRYDVEKIRVQYFDTETNTERTAIPDFYLIDTNELVEIKSLWTYKEQEMNDKIKSYKKNGYNVKLILEKKEI